MSSSGSPYYHFPYSIEFDIPGDCGITATRRVNGHAQVGEVSDLTSVFEGFLKKPIKPSRKEIREFFKAFISVAISDLTVDVQYAFFDFDIDNDETTFDAEISSKLEKIKRRVIDSIRQSIEHETEDSAGTDLVEKLLDDSGARLLLKSLNTESLLATSLDHDLRYLVEYWEDNEEADGHVSPELDQLELKLAKYEVRRRGLTIKDNGPLISRLQEDIRARIQAFNTPIKVVDRGVGVSGHFQPRDSHVHRKAQLRRHRTKGRGSSSEGIWKHITISRDETSASDFLRERIFILFFRRHFRAREYEEAEYNNPRQIEGSKLGQQEQHHSFPIYTRLETSGGETSSDQTPHQKAKYQSSPEKRSRHTVQKKEMDTGKQGRGVEIEGHENSSKTLILDELQDRQVVSRTLPLESEDVTLEKSRGPSGNWKVIHSLPHSVGQLPSAYLDKPVWAPGFGRDNFHLKAFLPVSNVQEYVQQSAFDFTIYRYYSESSLMPELRRALVKKQSPPDPVHYHEQIQLNSQQMIEALQELFTHEPELLKNFPTFDVRAPISAPYIFWYTCRSSATLQQLSLIHRNLIRTLTSWIDQNYDERYAEARRHLESGVVTLKSMPFLLCPGDVLVWKEKGKTKAAMASSQVLQRSPPILYWDSSEMAGLGNVNTEGSKRGEFSTTWGVDIWSYKFNGQFLRDKRSTEIKFKASSLEQQVDISKLGVYPLRFADEKTRLQLETRGKTFWTCRHRNLVSHTGGEGLVENGERFMVDFQVYKQLHSDSLKFKLLYEEDSDSSDESGASDHGDEDEDSESRHTINAEEMASDTPPSSPHVYLFPNTVPGYNLRSKKWVDLDVDYIMDVEWNKKSFENLVIDAKAKEMIQALVSHQIESEKGTDLIHRKGNGLIILLHGGPGTGKTFTAESVAEIAQKPLFCVTCGDIGTKPEEVEKYLESVLYLGKTWGCVVLIDEAEVFLEQRSLDNLERNALVSVFLRVLEYYEGILILTTNRVGTFDEAFKSRILLSLHYEKLTEGQRRKIWRGFINHLENTHAPGTGQNSGRQRNGTSALGAASSLKHELRVNVPDIDFQELRDYLEELASHELNGRQIRNIITTARQLAKFRKKTLDYGLIQEVIEMSGKFDQYFSKLNENQSDDQIARSDGLR